MHGLAKIRFGLGNKSVTKQQAVFEGKSQHNQAGIFQENGDRAVRTQVKGEENGFFMVYCCVFRNFFWRFNKNEIKMKEVGFVKKADLFLY